MGRKRRTRSAASTSILEYGYILLGSTLVALAFNLFLLPNKVASGGVSGISTILNSLLGWEPAYVQWAFNIPLFIAGVLLLGKQFGIKTLVGTIFLPFVVFLSKDMEPATNNALLGSLFGGIGVGLGLGIVFRGKASTGGTDLAAQIVHKYTGISLGLCVALIDGLIVLTSALAFSLEAGMYALISLYVTSKTIDFIQVGFGRSKMALIVTKQEAAVREGIFKNIDRGVTKLQGTGGFTDDERPVLMCVVEQTEFTKLKQLVKDLDPSAFVIVADAAEVLGEGFNRA
ncbi:YitT family protein [Ectobacillus antri]|jgi:uncharacterized membrane-anchored protein YitT (DUF2179 family)|uniref:YitT family protein n=1 Tax=Ectobacillus antri TaxID=2486280 RepID=A0ABT6H7N8_9BACI|nr:YitT family protein [Ectobacillus antri]MDG4657173.1 YitT family protein [Ectobacillus antri]MDG5754632.1 YitT family protein [Ectobacillus antri]